MAEVYNTSNYHAQDGSWHVNGSLVFGAGASIKSGYEALTGNTGTSTRANVLMTSASLTTAAAATQTLVITNSNAVVGDVATAVVAGGTNTRAVIVQSVVVTANTITITIRNVEASNALNGTVAVYVEFKKAA